jgi:ferredoxin
MNKKDGKAVLLRARGKKELFILPVHASEKELTQEVVKACPARVIKIM